MVAIELGWIQYGQLHFEARDTPDAPMIRRFDAIPIWLKPVPDRFRVVYSWDVES